MKSKFALALSIAIAAIGIFVLVFMGSNKAFPTSFFEGSNFPVGYEQTAPSVRISTSPALANQQTPFISKAIFVVGIISAIVFIFWGANDGQDKNVKVSSNKKTGWKPLVGMIGSLLIGSIALFSGYKYSNNYVFVDKARYDNWIKEGSVIQKTSTAVEASGSDTLVNLFKDKNWIK